MEGNVRWCTTQLRIQFPKPRGQCFQIPIVARVAEVEIAGDHGRSPDRSCEPADHDESDIPPLQHSQRQERVERWLAHRRRARSPTRLNGSVSRHSRTARRARSPGVKRSRSRIKVRSTSYTRLSTARSSLPHSLSSRSRVSTVGDTTPRSMRETAACGVAARLASSRCERRASVRAERSMLDAFMFPDDIKCDISALGPN